MREREEKKNFWRRKRGAIPFILIAVVIVVVLFSNEETSFKNNLEYEARIRQLKEEIKINQDSAQYYRDRRLAIENGTDGNLEEVGREVYHMQKPTEDVFIYGQK